MAWFAFAFDVPFGFEGSQPVGSDVSAVDRERRTIWIADAHRDDGKRFIVRADEKLTAFLELERAVCIHVLTENL